MAPAAEILIAVPVLGRPQNAAPVVASITEATTVPYRCLFLCSPDDEQQVRACRKTGAETITVPWPVMQGDFARKINYAYEASEEPWLFTGADDLRFHLGWDTHALATAAHTGAGVIGTQDLGNPLVKRGHTSTHSLVSRAYIEEFGAGTVDNSGKVFCELYSHQWTDTELVETARTRGRFAFSPKSVVEHLHPHWGKAEKDATYEKALSMTKRDMQLYLRRSRMIGLGRSSPWERRVGTRRRA